MRMTELIERKKRGGALDREQIAWWIAGYVAGELPDYQVAALLMAICLRGMTTDETVALTRAMAYSGDVVDLSGIDGTKVDKHSTGGVGDTTTLIAAPIAAACGIRVAKMSGRGLGHTGGTIDKLESIPGFNTALTIPQLVAAVNRAGLAVVGQSGNLVPADKKLYALRDVIAAVDSLPLIAASVMSKKIAAGADAIVLDVKTGSGAFMREEREAFALARAMVALGKGAGRETVAVVSDMDQPLGRAVGNSLEVWEAIDVLRGDGGGALRELSVVLAAEMLVLGGVEGEAGAAHALAEEALGSGRALEAFGRMIEAQGGERRVLDDASLLPQARERRPVPSGGAGFVVGVDAEAIGRAAMLLGAGRAAAGDRIDLAAGLVMGKRVGDRVEPGEPLAVLHVGRGGDVDGAVAMVRAAMRVGEAPPAGRPLVLGRVSGEQV